MTKNNIMDKPKRRSQQNFFIYLTYLKPSNIPLIVVVCLFSCITRLYRLDKPEHVCWDETHFGKMASFYLNRTFFFDVHPPLGKMLIAMAGHITGYDGKFAFDKPGDVYEHYTQYLGMRIFCAFLGLLIVPFVYEATKSLSNSKQAALIASCLLLFDNGMITLTRYILLDPPLLFFISGSFLGMAKVSFEYGPSKPTSAFTLQWWFWLFFTGVSITGAISVKFVGLFTVLLVGLRTAYDLWIILGDTSKPIIEFCKHLLARVILLILMPVILYTFFFWIHLNQLDNSGNGDGFYSSAFQSQLIGNPLHNSTWPIYLAYGAVVTMKNNRIGGGYLHSHWHLYPEGVGARQQQITTYSHKDANNKWLMKRFNDRPLTAKGEDVFVRHNDLIILEHIETKRNLHSHFTHAPITKRHYQVTGYGVDGIGDENDVWRIVKEQNNDQDDKIYTVKSKFKLIHYVVQCALSSHSRQLPKWGFEQLEVTCNPKLHDKNNYWNIEDNFYPQLPSSNFEQYKPSFLDRLIESHAVMFQGNSGLKPKEGEVTSKPWQWPLNYRGQFFSASENHKIYLLGNPVIWWFNVLSIPLSLLVMFWKAISNARVQIEDNGDKGGKRIAHKSNDSTDLFLESASWVFFAWLVHYLPFYFMGRVLYFHHYFPAFIFSSTLTALTYDYLITYNLKYALRLGSRIKITMVHVANFALVIIVIYTYIKFIPITYGTGSESFLATSSEKTNATSRLLDLTTSKKIEKLASLKWLDSWEF